MSNNNLNGLKKYLETRGYNVEFASDEELDKMYWDDISNYIKAYRGEK